MKLNRLDVHLNELSLRERVVKELEDLGTILHFPVMSDFTKALDGDVAQCRLVHEEFVGSTVDDALELRIKEGLLHRIQRYRKLGNGIGSAKRRAAGELCEIGLGPVSL